MTKRRASSPMRQLSRLRSRLIIILCVSLCVLAFLRVVLHSESNLQSSLPTSRRRSHAFIDIQFVGPPKVAFLFLVRRDLPLDFLWGTFFKNGDAAKFSIYVHSEPGFVFDESTTRSAFFFGRQLNNSIQVVWGESSMIEAERLLFEEALYDPANQRFVLLSDSCVPLYNFSYIYNYVMSSPKSFVDSFIDVKGRRYDPKMSPTIPKERWRKGSQWITLVRRHADIVVDDDTVFPIFREFCKRWPPTPLSFRRRLLAINWTFKLPLFTFQRHRNCIPDEHYVQTLLAISGLDNELERRAVTYTLWNQSTLEGKRKSWHPLTFDYADAAPQKLRQIKEINHVYNEYEQHNEFCHTNSKVTPCFLFARKFTLGAAMRVLREGLVGSYDVTAILRDI
ncbi:glycosyltransferase BC10-like [Rosa sericea]